MNFNLVWNLLSNGLIWHWDLPLPTSLLIHVTTYRFHFVPHWNRRLITLWIQGKIREWKVCNNADYVTSSHFKYVHTHFLYSVSLSLQVETAEMLKTVDRVMLQIILTDNPKPPILTLWKYAGRKTKSLWPTTYKSLGRSEYIYISVEYKYIVSASIAPWVDEDVCNMQAELCFIKHLINSGE